MTKRSRKKVRVGDSIPEVIWPSITRVQIACMAGATDDYNPLQIDDHLAKAEGFGGVFANPLLLLALFEQLLENFQDDANILRLGGTFLRLVRPGDYLIAKGYILEVHEDETMPHLEIELWAENQRKEVVAKGMATVLHTNALKGKTAAKKITTARARVKLQIAYQESHPETAILEVPEAEESKKKAPPKKKKATSTKKKKSTRQKTKAS